MIYLINMPFQSVVYPVIGIPIISALLKEAEIQHKIFYFNNDFAKLIGLFTYNSIVDSKTLDSRVMEWLFSDIVWDDDFECDDKAFFDYLEYQDYNKITIQQLYDTKKQMPDFIDECIKKLNITPDVKVIGFSCLFKIFPSLALGKKIKNLYPNIKLVYGGSAFHDVIGEELFDKLPWIDCISTSEADDIVVELFNNLSENITPRELQGILYRSSDNKISKTKGHYVSKCEFDTHIYPDFDSYFSEIERTSLYEVSNTSKQLIPFEMSRGCWWHEKEPCTFCGLNGVSLSFRSKKPDNIINMLKFYNKKYGISRFRASDNNLDMDYFKTLLPEFKEKLGIDNLEIYCAVKSNLNRTQIKQLSESSFTFCQPGIESLSDNLLIQMNKGVTAIQNLFFLKCARQYGIYTFWYILLCMFGEKQEDYDEIVELIPKIIHFIPPARSQAFVHCDKFSTYEKNREKYFTKIEPAKYYEYLYPKEFNIEKIAYYYDVSWDFPRGIADYTNIISSIDNWEKIWMTNEHAPEFYYEKQKNSTIILVDKRKLTSMQIALNLKESFIYELLDDIITKNKIIKLASTEGISESEVAVILDSFIKHNFAVSYDEKYLGLAMMLGFKEWTLSERIALLNM